MKTSQENIERIYKVVRYIEQAIDKEMSLDNLAAIAFFSPFHFQRVFKEVMGETPKQFIKRLRLEEAARLVAFSEDLNILDIALQVGFQSLEAFSRAFKDYYTVSPDNYRKSNEIDRINIVQTPYYKETLPEEHKIELSLPAQHLDFESLEIEIVNSPVEKCVFLQTTLQSPVLITESFKRIKLWASARELMNENSLVFGVIKDYPIFTSLDKCRYQTCVAVSKQPPITGLVNYLEIPASKYVAFQVQGGVAEIIKVASFIVHTWLPSSGYKLKLNPIIQIPEKDPSVCPYNENSSRIFIPVQPE